MSLRLLTDPYPAFTNYGPTWWSYTGDDVGDSRLPDRALSDPWKGDESGACSAVLGLYAPVTGPARFRRCTRPADHPGWWHAAAGTERVFAEWTRP